MKTVLVTGANKGIGLEIARQLAEKGHTVFLSARNPEAGEAARQALSDLGLDAHFLQMDVGDPASIGHAADLFGQQAGHLDVLVNNAGILLDEDVPILEAPPALVLQTLHTNALGPLFVTQAFRRFMGSGGRIVNLSSGAGQLNGPTSGWAPVYSFSKTALNGLTLQLSKALQHRQISVNAMCPGWVRTDMGGPTAPRSLAQGADTAVWLATEAPHALSGKFFRDRKEIPW